MNATRPSLLLFSVTLTTLHLAAQAASPLPISAAERQGLARERLERLHAVLRGFVDTGKHAGIITLVARNGRIVDWQAYGYRDLEAKRPMEKDTICRIYSMSKIVTSVAVLILFEEGRFSLDDPIGHHLPALKQFKVMNGGTAESPVLTDPKRPVTIKHLLTHTSGLIYDFDGSDELHKLYQAAKLWDVPSLNDFVARVAKLPLKHHPGDEFSYGINTDVLGCLVESVSGQSFEDFLQQRLFGPLQMKDTSFDVPTEKRDRLAKTYKHGADGQFVEAEPLINTWPERGRGIASGGAGLFSTIGDYARFAQMLLNGGALDGQRILGRKTVEFMTANHLTALPKPGHGFNPAMGFGLGVEMRIDVGKAAYPGSLGQFGWYELFIHGQQINHEERLVLLHALGHGQSLFFRGLRHSFPDLIDYVE
jgi:CubicO group peptidase (beta-lactamase class C family)